MDEKNTYWFPAKTYGWGWGIPTVWQGWVVLIGFIALVVAGMIWILPAYGAPVFVVYSFALTGVLIFVCWRTGEPSAWRWGKK